MPPESQAPQDQPSALTPDDHAANLALATHISTQLATPEQPSEGQETPLQTMQDAHQAPGMSAELEAMQKQIDALQKQVDKDPQDDIKEMKAMIEQALAEEDTNEHGKQS